MKKKLFLPLILFITTLVFSQEPIEKDSIINNALTTSLKGQVVNQLDKTPLKGAHLFNLNSVFGTITDETGKFDIATAVNDTIYISYLGYQSIKLKITNDLLKGNELVIELYEKTEQIEEVVLKSHKLIGVFEFYSITGEYNNPFFIENILTLSSLFFTIFIGLFFIYLSKVLATSDEIRQENKLTI